MLEKLTPSEGGGFLRPPSPACHAEGPVPIRRPGPIYTLWRRERLLNLYYLKISHNCKYLLITNLLQS